MADHLPDDLLADVLVRLAPRGLATSRGVCRSWRAVVDARRLLRADLLPLSLEGLLLEVDAWAPALFSRPSTGPATCDGLVGFLGADGTRQLDTYMRGHCNGLLLLQELVINPATGHSTSSVVLGRAHVAQSGRHVAARAGVFPLGTLDAVNLRKRLATFSIPEDPYSLLKRSEWQPSPLVLPVFSSRTGQSYRDRGDGPWLLRYLGEDDDDDKGQFEWSSDIEDLRTGLAAAMEMTMTPMSGLETWNTLISSDSILSRRLSSCVSQAKRGIAYHLDRSKIQDMATLDLRRTTEFIEMAFPYTPCWMGVFPENN
uniref:F-box domain-containing protein n=1 Tax=Setaria viridis TaxID=4556 RepID=A0A4U6SSV4_SETVI|nr:hypothetical protein SEVIR_9G090800v2 [Setaria viridis]